VQNSENQRIKIKMQAVDNFFQNGQKQAILGAKI
jgi:hypothetical protein